jgi:hypothetical protein
LCDFLPTTIAEAEADPAFRAILPSGALLDALQTAVRQRDSAAAAGRRGIPPPPGAGSDGWPDADVTSRSRSFAKIQKHGVVMTSVRTTSR